MESLNIMEGSRDLMVNLPAEQQSKTTHTPCNQLKALLSKNISIQKRQIGTNIIQILTPIIGLLMIKLVNFLAIHNLDRFIQLYEISVPFFLNLPYGMLANKELPIRISDCNQWYAIGYYPNATEATKKFIGSNTGEPFENQVSNGLLATPANVLSSKCPSVNKNVPYFQIFVIS